MARRAGRFMRVAGWAAALATVAPAASAAQPADGYALVWADEFSVDGRPDPARWTSEHGFKRNREAQWYQPENAFVKDGVLVIEARREDRPNPDFGKPGQSPDFATRRRIRYSSASLTTRGLHAWRYGRIEVRARIRAEAGLWPAIWTLGVEGKWPANGEVDVMEYYDRSLLANFAWAPDVSRTARWRAAKLPLSQLTDDPEWDRKFHTWTMDWTAERIVLLLDGREMNRIDLGAVRGHPSHGVTHPFRQPHYLLLNLALGGINGGSLTATSFPSRYEIDYVRVYQRPGEN